MLNPIFQKIYDRRISILFILIITSAFFFRIRGISGFSVNFDESVHGYFSYYLLKTGIYQFNSFSHGPFLYYVTALGFGIFGNSIVAGRLISAGFSTATILLLYPLRKWLGDAGLIASSSLMAFSPFFITFGQELRNDNFLIFFTMLMLTSCLLFLETGSRRYLVAASAGLGLALTVKENILLVIFVVILYFVILMIFFRNYLKEMTGENETERGIIWGLTLRVKENYRFIILNLIIVLSIYILFYTSFFTNISGFSAGIDSPVRWFRLALYPDPDTVKVYNFVYRNDPLEYIRYLGQYEYIPLVLGAAGGIYSFLRKERIMHFLSFWAVSLLFMYSVSIYKQPQHVLNVLLPLILLSGIFIDRILRNTAEKKRAFLVIVLIASVSVTSMISVDKMTYLHNAPGLSLKEYEILGTYLNDAGKDNKYAVIYSVENDPTQTFFPLFWYMREYSVEDRIISVNVKLKNNITYDASFIDDGIMRFKYPLILVPDNLAGNLEVLLKARGYEIKRTGAFVQNSGSKRELLLFLPIINNT